MNEQVLTMMTSAFSGVFGNFVAILFQKTEHDLGVDEIFGATETDEVNAVLSVWGTAHNFFSIFNLGSFRIASGL